MREIREIRELRKIIQEKMRGGEYGV